jgi:hypothetical protein
MAGGVVLGTGPEAENYKIRTMILPPAWIADVGGRNPENRVILGQCFQGCRRGFVRASGRGGAVAGGLFIRRMDKEEGVVAEISESFGQKAEVAMPEKLVGADGEVCVE